MAGERRRGGFDPLGSDREPDLVVRGDDPAPLARLLGSFRTRKGWDRRLDGARVHEVWVEAVGAELAQHVAPVRLHGGVLVVTTSSPAWATQVRYLSATLAARLNERLGEGMVTRVTVASPGGGTRGRPPRSRG